MSLAGNSARLRDALERCAEPSALRSFAASVSALDAAPDLDRLLTAFASAARLLGRARLPNPALVLEGPDDPVACSQWTADVAGRALLLLTVAQRAPAPQHARLVEAAYRDGDTLEKLAVVRTLPLLPNASAYVSLSLDAGRTNDARLFAAVACDTPYPARHYPELEWNKLFMKAAFVGAPLERIIGLERRENPELARMALEYIEERESAGRAFPSEIWRAIAPFPPAGATGKLLGYASHATPGVRLGAARALIRLRQPRAESFVRERLEVESDDEVRKALQAALDALQAVAHTESRGA